MFDFYNSSFQVLFSFGRNHPQQIVAKAAGKVKVFHKKTEEKIKEGLLFRGKLVTKEPMV